MAQVDYSYIGSGKVYMRNINTAGAGLTEIGNVSALGISIDEEEKSLRDYRSPGGGTINEVRRIKGAGLTMTMANLSPENLAMALYGEKSAVTGASVTGEEVTARLDALVPLAHMNPTSVTVKNEAETTTYVAGTDYEVRTGGIYILSTGSIADDQALKVSYTYGAQDVVEAMTSSAQEFELFFEGLNEARSGKASIVRVWRARFGAAKNLALIGDDYANLELTGKALADTTKPTGKSQYFQATILA